jgi:hypothetical protein
MAENFQASESKFGQCFEELKNSRFLRCKDFILYKLLEYNELFI